jgi:cell division protein FtsZ
LTQDGDCVPDDQWAVLRQEVEGENMKHKRAWADYGQQHSEEDGASPQSSLYALEQAQHHVDIVVAGVGGGGMNAVNRMISTRVRGVRFISMNTDAQVLSLSEAPTRICLGEHYTKGLGAGGNASVGTRAATESETEIRDALGNADLVFIAAGMGGGTGTGAAPVVASIAKKLGALTIGIVTLPFTFEGTRRRRIAEAGIAELSSEIDALISVPNDRLLSITGHDRSLSDAFKLADDVLRQGVQGIAEVINVPGLVNVDFADVRSVLREAGTALMSIGQGHGRNRAQHAAEEAIAGGFLNVTIRGAQRVLFNISGGEDMTLFEVNEVAECIGSAVDNLADITFGAVVDPALDDTIRVTLIAAGMEERRAARPPSIHSGRADQPRPAPSDLIQAPSRPAPAPPQARPASPVEPLPAKPTPQQTRLPGPPARPQRSLDDLRGLRSLGRRSEASKDEKSEPEEVDIPPFLRKPN